MKIGLIDIPVIPFNQPKEFERLNRIKCELEDVWAQSKGSSVENYTKKSYSIGLLNLSAYVKSKLDGVVFCYTHYTNKLKIKCFAKNCDFIGISTMSPFESIVMDICKYIKKINPNVKIIIGGPGPTNEPENYLLNKNIDYVILGEGEKTFFNLIRGKKLSYLKGFGYKINNKNLINYEIDYLKNNNIPDSDYSLLEFDLNKYNLNITTMRGCLYNCAFCAKIKGKIRFRKISNIITELKFLDDKLNKGTLVHFSDNIISINQNRFNLLMNKIIKCNFKNIYFACDLRANHTTKEIVKKLSAANFKRINLGIEDSNNSVLKKINKQLVYKDMINAMKIIKENSNALISVYWMIGLPGTTDKTISQNLDKITKLLINNKVDFILPSLMKPYPGSKITTNPNLYNIKLVNSWGQWVNNYYLPLWNSKRFSSKQLSNINKLYLKTIILGYKKRSNKKYTRKLSFKNTIGL